MSAGGSGEAAEGMSHNTIMGVGLLGGLIGIYAAHFLGAMLGSYASFLGGLGAVAAVVWGAAAVRRVASYGLGTGVPSIGMIALGMGIVAATFGLAVGGVAGPVVAVIFAALIGLLVGLLANTILKMGIPIMVQSMAEISISGTLTIIGLSVAMVGSFTFADVLTGVIATGYIAVIFIAGGLAILHPFNANLGPDEKQDRTLATAVEKGAIAVIIAGIVATINAGASGALTIIVGVALWYIGFSAFYKFVKRDSFSVLGTGLLPTEEELA